MCIHKSKNEFIWVSPNSRCFLCRHIFHDFKAGSGQDRISNFELIHLDGRIPDSLKSHCPTTWDAQICFALKVGLHLLVCIHNLNPIDISLVRCRLSQANIGLCVPDLGLLSVVWLGAYIISVNLLGRSPLGGPPLLNHGEGRQRF